MDLRQFNKFIISLGSNVPKEDEDTDETTEFNRQPEDENPRTGTYRPEITVSVKPPEIDQSLSKTSSRKLRPTILIKIHFLKHLPVNMKDVVTEKEISSTLVINYVNYVLVSMAK